MRAQKPESVTIVVLNRKSKKSRSLTVYEADVDQVFKTVKELVKKKRS